MQANKNEKDKIVNKGIKLSEQGVEEENSTEYKEDAYQTSTSKPYEEASENQTYANFETDNQNDSFQLENIPKKILTLKFPFNIGDEERKSEIVVEVERISEIVSFSIPYDLALSIDGAELISKTYIESNTLYTFQFDNIEDSIDWVKNKIVSVEFKPRNGDLNSIRNEMNDIMSSYEAKERESRKKKKMIDEDGFTYYG